MTPSVTSPRIDRVLPCIVGVEIQGLPLHRKYIDDDMKHKRNIKIRTCWSGVRVHSRRMPLKRSLHCAKFCDLPFNCSVQPPVLAACSRNTTYGLNPHTALHLPKLRLSEGRSLETNLGDEKILESLEQRGSPKFALNSYRAHTQSTRGC